MWNVCTVNSILFVSSGSKIKKTVKIKIMYMSIIYLFLCDSLPLLLEFYIGAIEY